MISAQGFGHGGEWSSAPPRLKEGPAPPTMRRRARCFRHSMRRRPSRGSRSRLRSEFSPASNRWPPREAGRGAISSSNASSGVLAPGRWLDCPRGDGIDGSLRTRCNSDPGVTTMALLPRFAFAHQQAQAAQLERQVSALQARLDHCAGVARRWKATRCGIVAGVAAGALTAGGVLGAYRQQLLQPTKDLAQSVGIAAAPASADAAYAAYQNNDYPAALRLVRPLAEAGDARAQSLLALCTTAAAGCRRTTASLRNGSATPP